MNIMEVVKRDGQTEKISFDKILNRVEKLCLIEPKLLNIQLVDICKDVISKIYNGIKTSELDELSANICSSKTIQHLEYGHLASRIIISNNQKNTLNNFGDKLKLLLDNGNITQEIYDIYLDNKDILEDVIDYKKDFNFDFFGFRTLEKAYLSKIKGKVIERIQDMLLRVSLGIHKNDINEAITTYQLMSDKYFVHASPTLFNAGTKRPQLLSCFLLGMHDSIDGMYKCISDCAKISKWAGGIGIHMHGIRGSGAHIYGTNGKSSGIVPLLRTLNQTARHVNQGGKRLGSFAIYLEPHHPDILEFLDCKKNTGAEEQRARDLFYSMWISDLFMERVENDDKWSLFCPHETPGLSDAYGQKYKDLYTKYENQRKAVKTITAREIWFAILTAQMETGTPYICYKDSANQKSNQQHYGTIKSSNLCSEIIEYSDDKEYACCTLASIGLPRFVQEIDYSTIKDVKIITKDGCCYCEYAQNYLEHYNIPYQKQVINDTEQRKQVYTQLSDKYKKTISSVPQIFINNDQYVGGFNDFLKIIRPKFNFTKLIEVTKVLIKNLNKIVDLNYYPVPECELSNKKHRPLGLGVQGLADVFNKMRISFDSEEAALLNKQIFATIYYAAAKESNRISTKYSPYETFKGSPSSKGLLQFDLWNTQPIQSVQCINQTIHFDWKQLKDDIIQNGLYNSLLISCMPTASTGQILGNTEAIEPCTSYLYSRSTLSGTFIVLNKDLQKELLIHKSWNNLIKDKILLTEGSIQDIPEIPQFIKNIYKNVWDLSNKSLIQQSADRGSYICQSQSLNLFIKEPDYENLTSMHFYAWKSGLKTGIYYLRSLPKGCQKFSLDVNLKLDTKKNEQQDNNGDDEGCVMCSG